MLVALKELVLSAMIQNMYDIILQLQNWRIMEISFITAIVLVLIDYFFPVDYLAYIAYALFGLGMFLALPFGPLLSFLFALGLVLLLLAMHIVWFSHFLTNAPGVDVPDLSSSTNDQAAA